MANAPSQTKAQPMDCEMIERIAEAIYDFLDERFPGAAMPGGQQLFADDPVDAEFKHEAGCEALAQAAYSVMAGRIEELETVVRTCADKFGFYEQLHRLKCTAEGDEKADRNRELADMCRAALPSMLKGNSDG